MSGFTGSAKAEAGDPGGIVCQNRSMATIFAEEWFFDGF